MLPQANKSGASLSLVHNSDRPIAAAPIRVLPVVSFDRKELGLILNVYGKKVAAGEWRDREGHGYEGRIESNDPIIDASAKMPDGTAFSGVEGLQEQLLKKEDLFLTALASQLYTYGLGRELGFSDRPAVRASVVAMKRNRYLLRALLLTIVQSDLFTTK